MLSPEVVRSGDEVPLVVKCTVLLSSTVLCESGVVFFELVAVSVVSLTVVNVEVVSWTLVISAVVLSLEGVATSELVGEAVVSWTLTVEGVSLLRLLVVITSAGVVPECVVSTPVERSTEVPETLEAVVGIVVVCDWLDNSADTGDDERVVISALFVEKEDVLRPSVVSAGAVTSGVALSVVLT